MGDPRKLRKKWSGPRHPWRSEQLARELYLIGTYGLRNKRELWKAMTELSRIRKQARGLLATPADVREKKGANLLSSLYKKGLVDKNATLDDVLSLTIENLLERRLQTIVWRKGLAKTPQQARQLITHRHIKIGDRIVNVPGYMVLREEEDKVKIREDSPIVLRLVSQESS